jgi:hypothetical protein
MVSQDRPRFSVNPNPLHQKMEPPSYNMPLQQSQSSRQFRLLKIYYGFNKPLSGELMNFTIHGAPPFRALSYTWNTAFDDANAEVDLPTSTLIVDGKPMPIGGNLELALKAFRDWHGGADTFVWADAICINQANFAERAYQVAIMGEIYKAADSIFVWLGPEAQDSARAMDFLKMLARCRRDMDSSRDRTLALARNPVMEAEWRALEALWKRRWWQRVWVLQETALARRSDFYCGRCRIADEDLYDGTRALREVWTVLCSILASRYDVKLRVPTYHAIDGVTRIRKARLQGIQYNMLTCHYRTSSPRATDPRDYIFSKIGMASDGHLASPNYTESVQQVYTKFVVDYIRGTKCLDIIHLDARPRVIPGLPSWVPDWSAHHSAAFIQPELTAAQDQSRVYRASHGRPADAIFRESDTAAPTLRCRGRLFDVVDGVAPTAMDASYEDSYEYERPVFEGSQPRLANDFYGGPAELLNAICNTLFLTVDHHGSSWPPDACKMLVQYFVEAESRILAGQTGDAHRLLFDRMYRCIRTFEIGGRRLSSIMRSVIEDGIWSAGVSSKYDEQDIEWASSDSMLYRCLLTTNKGAVGSGPMETRPGDVVAVLDGGLVPVILRPVADQQYAVVGAGFVHGIMYGEAAIEGSGEWFSLI